MRPPLAVETHFLDARQQLVHPLVDAPASTASVTTTSRRSSPGIRASRSQSAAHRP